jgi:plasmid stabilization system protein ParE
VKVVYTDDASEDLDGILAYIASNYPAVYDAFLIRLRSVIARIGMWPDSAQEVAERPGVRILSEYRRGGRDHVHPSRRAGRMTGHLSQLLSK